VSGNCKGVKSIGADHSRQLDMHPGGCAGANPYTGLCNFPDRYRAIVLSAIRVNGCQLVFHTVTENNEIAKGVSCYNLMQEYR